MIVLLLFRTSFLIIKKLKLFFYFNLFNPNKIIYQFSVMKTKYIYIIGDIPSKFDDKTFEKFKNAELDMISRGFRVYNPLSEVNAEARGLSNELKY